MKKTTGKAAKILQGLIMGYLGLIPATSSAQSGGAIFTVGPVMHRLRIDPNMTTMDDGRIATFGGREYNFVSCAYADLYDPGTNTFTEVAMNNPHDMSSVVKLSSGKYMLVGGSMDLGVAPGYATTETFNPATNTFSATANMNYARCWMGATQLANGKVLVAGAWYNTPGATYGDVYDTATNTFTLTAAMNQPRANPMVLPTNDTGAMVFGGWPSYGGTNYTSVEYYSYADNSFHPVSSEILTSDPGWLVSGTPYQRSSSADFRMGDGKYLLLANRSTPTNDFALLTFDPATKAFARIATSSPLMDAATDGGFYDIVLDKTNNYAYLLGVDSGSDPLKLSLVAVDLATGTVYHSGTSYTLPASEYLYPNMAFIPSNGKILLEGISTSNSDYYHATDKTYLLTPTPSLSIETMRSKETGILVYPNPVDDRLNLRFNQETSAAISVHIYDLTGRILITGNYATSGSMTTIPTTQLASGLYICEVTCNGMNQRYKILKQ